MTEMTEMTEETRAKVQARADAEGWPFGVALRAVREEAQVASVSDPVLAQAVEAGATVLVPGTDTVINGDQS